MADARTWQFNVLPDGTPLPPRPTLRPLTAEERAASDALSQRVAVWMAYWRLPWWRRAMQKEPQVF